MTPETDSGKLSDWAMSQGVRRTKEGGVEIPAHVIEELASEVVQFDENGEILYVVRRESDAPPLRKSALEVSE